MGTRLRTLGKRLILIALALGGVAGRPAAADEPPVSLVDWLKAKGEDAGFEARRALFARLVSGDVYTGSAEQNVRLLAALTSPTSAAKAGNTGGGGGEAQRRTTSVESLDVTYDLSSLVLALEIPEDWRYSREPITYPAPPRPEQIEESPILPRLPTGATTFVCAAVLAQKAKQFDDGLYAAVEEAFEGGPDGKRQLLYRLRERLAAQGRPRRGRRDRRSRGSARVRARQRPRRDRRGRHEAPRRVRRATRSARSRSASTRGPTS